MAERATLEALAAAQRAADELLPAGAGNPSENGTDERTAERPSDLVGLNGISFVVAHATAVAKGWTMFG